MPIQEIMLDRRQIDFIAWKCGVTIQDFLDAIGIAFNSCANGLPFRFLPLVNYYCLYKCGYGLADLVVLSNEYLEDREFFKVCYLRSHHNPQKITDRARRHYVSDQFIARHNLKPAFIAYRPDGKVMRYWFRYDFYKVFGMGNMIDQLLKHPLRLWRLDHKATTGRHSFHGMDNYIHSYRAVEFITGINHQRVLRIEEGVISPTLAEINKLRPYTGKYGSLSEWKRNFDRLLAETPIDLSIGEDSMPKRGRVGRIYAHTGDKTSAIYKLDYLGKKPVRNK